MRYRKKDNQGLPIGLGKKKSSVNIGGLNIPINKSSGGNTNKEFRL